MGGPRITARRRLRLPRGGFGRGDPGGVAQGTRGTHPQHQRYPAGAGKGSVWGSLGDDLEELHPGFLRGEPSEAESFLGRHFQHPGPAEGMVGSGG